MGIMQLNTSIIIPKYLLSVSSFSPLVNNNKIIFNSLYNKKANNDRYDPLLLRRGRRRSDSHKGVVVAVTSSSSPPLNWESWSPDKASPSPSPSMRHKGGREGAFAALGKMDQMLAARGASITIAPLGAVCAVLFITPKSPAARKYNMFMAQIGCAAIGVLAFSIFGPGWLAKSSALAASIAFMIYTTSTHPPAASLPLLFIDGAKFHGLNFWYALFPGAAGCILISLIQEIVSYLQENVKF